MGQAEKLKLSIRDRSAFLHFFVVAQARLTGESSVGPRRKIYTSMWTELPFKWDLMKSARVPKISNDGADFVALIDNVETFGQKGDNSGCQSRLRNRAGLTSTTKKN